MSSDKVIIAKSIDEDGYLDIKVDLSQLFDADFSKTLIKEVSKSIKKVVEKGIVKIVEEVFEDMSERGQFDSDSIIEIVNGVIKENPKILKKLGGKKNGK